MVLGVPESVDSPTILVRVRFAALAIGEVPVYTTGSDVHDEVELLVERCVEISLVFPRVVTFGPAAFLPEGLVRSVNIEDNVGWGVEVSRNAVLGSNEAVDVEVICKG